uniref:Uncharacterized protein n=1 Tax=Trypanosoma congolense (strain IL3000) TaxID=1068625 RepID=G0URA3_TRYCI|nr:hypothetical protein, unlikely [Trypanosoma congolense IL3000]
MFDLLSVLLYATREVVSAGPQHDSLFLHTRRSLASSPSRTMLSFFVLFCFAVLYCSCGRLTTFWVYFLRVPCLSLKILSNKPPFVAATCDYSAIERNSDRKQHEVGWTGEEGVVA